MRKIISKKTYYPWFSEFLIACSFLLLTISYSNASYQASWELLFQPRQRIVKSIGVYNEQIFIGTGNGIFVSSDFGKNFNDFGTEQLQKDINGVSTINWIYIDKNEIYVGTSFGAYYSDISSPSWTKVFESTKTESNQVNSVFAENDLAYVCTDDGFWECGGKQNNCSRLNGGISPEPLAGNHEVLNILILKDKKYLTTSNGVYLFNNQNNSWEDIANNIQTLPDGKINARHLISDSNKNLWLATGDGVYLSTDSGKSWINKSNGIRKNTDGFQEVFYLLEDNNCIYAGCGSGVFYLDLKEGNQWTDVSNGLRTKDGSKNVYYLAKLKNNLYAATDEGLFVAGDSLFVRDSSLVLKGKIEIDFARLELIEPSVIEVQKQALKFASLPTEKDYKRYRTQARIRNLLPKLGIDLNTTGQTTNYYQYQKGISTNISLDNSFDADNLNRYQRDGKSFKQLSVLWDANQFIYDDNVIDILNQARLTTNIRENLLDDVTRIYFQRRKLQLEHLTNKEQDKNQKLLKELEIAELTGQLDSRTGGWFTREIKKRKRKNENT